MIYITASAGLINDGCDSKGSAWYTNIIINIILFLSFSKNALKMTFSILNIEYSIFAREMKWNICSYPAAFN